MSSQHGFISAFAAELDAYLTFKQNMGFVGASRVWYLRRFDAYCGAHDLTVFDQETVGVRLCCSDYAAARGMTLLA